MSCRSISVGTAVVGGGITGLSSAHHLQGLLRERGVEPSVVVLESSPRLGGLIRTERTGDYLLEGGPDTILAIKPGGISLCERLGLGADVRFIGPNGSGTHILHRGRLVKVPDGFMMMAPTRFWATMSSPLFSTRGKLRMAMERFIGPRSGGGADESLSSFVTRRFGREVLDRVAEPIIANLFTADADRLSLKTLMPRFLDMEQKHGSVTRALALRLREARAGAGPKHPGHFAYVRGGLGRIVDRLRAELPEATVKPGVTVTGISRDPVTRLWRLATRGAGDVEAESLILACPAHVSAPWLGGVDARLAGELRRLRYASCATVYLVYRKGDVRRRLDSFGFFVPRTEGSPLLACSFMSVKFDDRVPDGEVLIRAFLGGPLHENVLERDDESLCRLAHDGIRGVLGVAGEPVLATTYRFSRAMPQYEVGFPDRLETIGRCASEHPGLFLAGSAVGAIGLPDCIASGERAARGVAEFRGERMPARRLAAR